MATKDQFKEALLKAHGAGDFQAAELFAERIKSGNYDKGGVWDALKGGIAQTGDAIGYAFDVWGDNPDEILDRSRKERLPKTESQEAYIEEIERRRVETGDENWGQAIRNVWDAASEQPLGAFHEGIAQLPNMAAVMAPAVVGALPGVFTGNVPLALAGGAAGMGAGTVAIETGFQAQELVADGEMSQQDIDDALRQGLIKGGVITVVDLLTLKLNRMMGGIPADLAEAAINQALRRAGVNAADKHAVRAVLSNKPLYEEVMKAGADATAKSMKVLPRVGRGAASTVTEALGETTGEYTGSLAAGLEASRTDAIQEGLLSAPFSAAETVLSRQRLSAGENASILNPMDAMLYQREAVLREERSQADRDYAEQVETASQFRTEGITSIDQVDMDRIVFPENESEEIGERARARSAALFAQTGGFGADETFTADGTTVVDSTGRRWGPELGDANEAAVLSRALNERAAEARVSNRIQAAIDNSPESYTAEQQQTLRMLGRRVEGRESITFSAETIYRAENDLIYLGRDDAADANNKYQTHDLTARQVLDLSLPQAQMTPLQRHNVRRLKAGMEEQSSFTPAEAKKILGVKFGRLAEGEQGRLPTYRARMIKGEPVVVHDHVAGLEESGEKPIDSRPITAEEVDGGLDVAGSEVLFGDWADADAYAKELNSRKGGAFINEEAEFENPEWAAELINEVLKSKNITDGINSPAIRALAEIFTGVKPRGRKTINNMSAGEKRVLFSGLRSLPRFSSPTSLPVFGAPENQKLSTAPPLALPAPESVNPVIISAIRAAMKGFGLERIGAHLMDRLKKVTIAADGRIILGQKLGKDGRMVPVEDFALETDGFYHPAINEIFLGLQNIISGAQEAGPVTPEMIEQAVISTLSHEVLHALRQMDLFTQAEWKVLSAAAGAQINPTSPTPETYTDWAASVYPNLTPDQQLEEAVAEMTSHAMTGKLSLGGRPRSLMRRIVEFFKRMLNVHMNTDPKTWQEIMAAVKSGDVGGREEGQIRSLREVEREGGRRIMEAGRLVGAAVAQDPEEVLESKRSSTAGLLPNADPDSVLRVALSQENASRNNDLNNFFAKKAGFKNADEANEHMRQQMKDFDAMTADPDLLKSLLTVDDPLTTLDVRPEDISEVIANAIADKKGLRILRDREVRKPLVKKISAMSPVELVDAINEAFDQGSAEDRAGRRWTPSSAAPLESKRMNEAFSHFDGHDVDVAKKEAGNFKSRLAIVFMTPAQFLSIAENGFDKNKYERVKSLDKYNSLPSIRYSLDGDVATVEGHEGRHRASEIARRGGDLIPVQISGESIRFDQQDDPANFDYKKVWPKTLRAETEFQRGRGQEIPFPVQQGQSGIISPDMSASSEILLSKRLGKHGMYSAVENAIDTMKLPQFTPSKRNPEGKALGRDIWYKIKSVDGVKGEELKWIGLEDFLLMESEDADTGTVRPNKYTRDEVADFIVNNGVNIEVVTADRGAEEAGSQLNWERVDNVDAVDFPNFDFHKLEGVFGLGQTIFQVDDVPNFYITVEYAEEDVVVNADHSGTKLASVYHVNPELVGVATPVLRGLSFREAQIQAKAYAIREGLIEDIEDTKVAQWGEFNMAGDHSNYREVKLTAPDLAENTRRIGLSVAGRLDQTKTFEEPNHYPDSQVIAFMRVDDRKLPDVVPNATGFFKKLKAYFIDEIQSDLHQKGRQFGYNSAESPVQSEVLSELHDLVIDFEEKTSQEINQALSDMGMGTRGSDINLERVADVIQAMESPDEAWSGVGSAWRDIRTGLKHLDEKRPGYIDGLAADLKKIKHLQKKEIVIADGGIPEAPFKKEANMRLALKRAIIEAVEGGYEAIAWPRAQVVIDRWSDESAELYTNLYDSLLPSLMRKLTKEPVSLSQTPATTQEESLYWIVPVTEKTIAMVEAGVPLMSKRRKLANYAGKKDRLSTRVPRGPSATENPLTSLLSIGLDDMERGGALEKNLRLIEDGPANGVYSSLKPHPDVNATPRAKMEHYKEQIVENLLWLHDQMTPEIRARAKMWYMGARKQTERWAKKYNLKESQVAAVIASLSPEKDWFQNMSLAERVMDIWSEQQNFQPDSKMIELGDRIYQPTESGGPRKGKVKLRKDWTRTDYIKQSIWHDIKNKTLGELTKDYDRALWVRAFDQTHNPRRHRMWSPEGDMLDYAKTKSGKDSVAAWGYMTPISKAISVQRDGSRENISLSLGEEHKVRNFYNNIIAPMSDAGEVTIDTHAVAAGLLMPLGGSAVEVKHVLGGSSSSKPTGSSGMYPLFADAYREAARRVDSDADMLAREMQSITWEEGRTLFSSKTDKIKADTINVWNEYQRGSIDVNEARRKVYDISGGTHNPPWAKPSAGLNGRGGSSTYRGKLSGAGVPRGGANSSTAGTTRGDAARSAGERGRKQGLHRDVYARHRAARSGRGKARSYARGSKRTLEGLRNVVGVYKPTPATIKSLQAAELPAVTLHELTPVVMANEYRNAIIASKEGSKFGAAVYVYPVEEYAGMRLFQTPDGTSGFAIKSDGDIVSVYTNGGGKVLSMLELAVDEGGTKLDAFDTVLPDIYGMAGFKETRRVPWSDEHAADDWDKKVFAKFNNGEPDVVDMEYKAKHIPNKGSDTVYSKRSKLSSRAYTPEQLAAIENTYTDLDPKKPFAERWAEGKKRWRTKLRQGVVDQFASLKDVLNDPRAWMLGHLTSSSTGALEAAIEYGQVFLHSSGVLQIDPNKKSLKQILQPLGEDLDDFMKWVAANRANRLMGLEKENLMSQGDIKAFLSLAEGNTADGRDRGDLFRSSAKELDGWIASITDVGVGTGLINAKEAAVWAEEGFYLPFYRVMDENSQGPRSLGSSGLVRQKAYNEIKGGTNKLDDLLSNLLLNSGHILGASLKNQAATAAIEAAQRMNSMARHVMPSAASKRAIFILKDGKKVWYELEGEGSELVLDSLVALNWEGLSGMSFDVMRAFKRTLTTFVTASPEFKMRNLIRDTIQAIAVADMSTNISKNLYQGIKLTDKKSSRYAQMLAGGAIFGDSGYIHGADPDAIRYMVAKGVQRDTILDSRQALKKVWDWYQDQGSRLENINRAANYEQALNSGRDLLEATFEARDHLDFSRTGTFPAVRAIAQIVPFLNSRLQGLDKLIRAGSFRGPQAAQFYTVLSMYTMASLALYLSMKDDEEFKELEEWKRDTYHAFKLPGSETMFFIPRPFELGAIANSAERLLEQLVDDDVHGELFAERMGHAIFQTFSFNPIPQAVKPALEVATNKNWFTGRQIENIGMSKLSPEKRRRAWTSESSIVMSELMGAVIPWEKVVLSPPQIEHLVRGYLGWVGTQTLALVDAVIVRPARGVASRPSMKWTEYPIAKAFASSGVPKNTKYTAIFYERLSEAERAAADMRDAREVGDIEEQMRVLKENGSILQWRKTYNKQQKRLRLLGKEAERILRDKTLSSDEKEAAIDRVNLQKNRLTKLIDKASRDSF